MKRSYASQSPRTRKKDVTEVNGCNSEEPEEEEEEEEEDPEEIEEDPEEIEKDQEEIKEDPEEIEEDPEEIEEDPEEIEDDREEVEEDPSEEYASQPSCESESDAADDKHSNDRKRLVDDETEFGSPPFQINQPQKKTRYEGSKSGNPRRSRWDTQPEQEAESFKKRRSSSRWDPLPDGDTYGIDGTSRRKKTRWSRDDGSQLKMLGPLQLPDFVGSQNLDPEILRLQSRLFEINKKLQKSELHDDRPEGERSPSPQPIYNNHVIRINTREVTIRQKLTEERQLIISKLIEKNPSFKTPENVKLPSKLSKKVYIPVKEYPDYNFIGLIMGPRGNTQKRMEKETGAKILLRGKGYMKVTSRKFNPFDDDDLHVYIEASDQNSLDAAVAMVEKLLIPLEVNEHKRAQLKELAKINGTFVPDVCNICKEKDHKAYACPQRPSGLHTTQCGKCGSVLHPTTSCSATKTRKQIPNDAKLYVGYLPQSVDENRLKELFSPFGKIISASVILDRTTGTSKGYGFVNFESPVEAAGAVMQMNGYKMDGKTLVVRVAGRPPVAGPTVVAPPTPSVPWVGMPRPLLPGAQLSFPYAQGVAMAPASIALLPFFGGPQCPPAVVSSLGDSMNAFSSPSLVSQFPGDPDYRSTTPSLVAQFPGDADYHNHSSTSTSVTQFPGDPDYRSSAPSLFLGGPDYLVLSSSSTSPSRHWGHHRQYS